MIKNLVIFCEPSIFLCDEVSSHILRQGMWLSINSDWACCLLIFLADLILLFRSFRLLLLFLFHLCISRFITTLWCALLFRSLLRLLRCRDIFFNSNLFFLYPFLLKISRFKTRNLVNVVANSQDKGNLFIVFWFSFFDSVSGNFFWKSLNQLNTLRIVNK